MIMLLYASVQPFQSKKLCDVERKAKKWKKLKSVFYTKLA